VFAETLRLDPVDRAGKFGVTDARSVVVEAIEGPRGEGTTASSLMR